MIIYAKSSPSLIYGKEAHFVEFAALLIVLMLLLDIKHINLLDEWILNQLMFEIKIYRI